MSAFRSTPRIFIAFTLLLLLGHSASAAPKPASETNPSISPVTVAYDVSGAVPGDLPPVVSLIVDRTQLRPGDHLPDLDQTQILVTESGSLQLTDGIGITSNLNDNRQLYAPRGSVSRVTATTATQILRAHIDASAETNGLVTITGSSCSPSTLALPVDRPLTVANQTDDSQPFRVGGIQEELAPGAWRTIPMSDLTPGKWTASCGRQTTGAAPLALVALSIEKEPPVEPVDVTSTTTLLNDRIVLGSQAFSRFFLQRIDLAAGATIDTSFFSGPTALIAGDQPLALLRPDHRLVILPAQSPILLGNVEPTLVSNQGGFPATLLVAGFRTEATISAPVNRTPNQLTGPGAPSYPPAFNAAVPTDGAESPRRYNWRHELMHQAIIARRFRHAEIPQAPGMVCDRHSAGRAGTGRRAGAGQRHL